MANRVMFVLVLALAAVILLSWPAFSSAGGWSDLGHGLALDPSGQVVELAGLSECQKLAADQAKWSP